MSCKTDREPPIPAAARPAHDAIVALTDAFCQEHLNAEYEALCRKLVGVLARKRPSRDLLKIRQFDSRWMLRQHIEESPMAWMIEVNGFVLDARRLKREIQEEAYLKGLIPYIPGEKPTAEKSTDGEEGSHP